MVRRMQAIAVKNLSFNYDKQEVFNDFNLNIVKGQFVTILGKNGSGKSTLAKIIYGDLKYKGQVFIYNELVCFKTILKIRKNISFVRDYYDEYSFNGTVLEELLRFSSDKKKVYGLSKKLGIYDVLFEDSNLISLSEKKLLVLGISLLRKTSILILDNTFEGMNYNLKMKIIKMLKKNKITVLNFTHDVEDCLVSDKILNLNNNFYGSKEELFDDSFDDFELPFVVNLSYKLKFYDLIDTVYYDEKALVDDLWK